MIDSTTKQNIRATSTILLLALIVCAWTPSERALAQQGDTLGTSAAIDLEAGYFLARRGDFRDLYGSWFCFGAAFERRCNAKLGWAVQLGFDRLSKDEFPMSYWSLSFTPLVKRTLAETASFRFSGGAGIGLSYRKISAEYGVVAVFPKPRITQDELGPMAMLMVDLGYKVSPSVILGTRLYYDHHFFSDPTIGKFGDTGGFHLKARIGFVL